MATTDQADAVVEEPQRKITFEEFLETYHDVHVEWVAGEAVFMAPISEEHDKVSGNAYFLLKLFVHRRKLGRVLQDPFVMKLRGVDQAGRAPDVCFVRAERMDDIRRNYLDGPADLAVEVSSPSTHSVDRSDKFQEYEVGGVGEYWILDPDRQIAEFYQLDQDGVYRPAPAEHGVYHSQAVEGFWLRLEWLWSEPEYDDVIRAWDAA